MSSEARDEWIASREVEPGNAPEPPQTVAQYNATIARLGARFPGMVRQRSH